MIVGAECLAKPSEYRRKKRIKDIRSAAGS